MNLKEDIKNRLEYFRYTLKESDNFALKFVIDTVEKSIKSCCNREDIPDELYEIEIDRICGEFLFEKKQSGQLNEYDFEASIKEIKDLDTTVVYAVGSDSSEKQFDLLIDGLRNCGEREILSFRRLRW